MIWRLRLRWARLRARLARWALSKLLGGRDALSQRSQLPGKIIAVRVRYNYAGWPEKLFVNWLADGADLRDLREIDAREVRYNGKTRTFEIHDR